MKPPVLHFPFASSTGVHKCRIEFDWLGTERYYVDDHLVLRQWSLLGKTAAFTVDDVNVEIRSQIWDRQAVTEVLLNGHLTFSNLLDEYNRELIAKIRRYGLVQAKPMTLTNWLGNVLVWTILAYGFFTIYKWLERHAA
jgi:hypothetical protein